MSFFQNLKDKVSNQKLREMISELYPQYKYIRIKRNGDVILKRNWWTWERRKMNSFTLCTNPNELPERISQYAHKMLSTEYDLDRLLKYIVSVRFNYEYPIIDKLYLEFIQIKYSAIWLHPQPSITSKATVTMSQLIRMSKPIRMPWIVKDDITNIIGELHKLLTKKRFLPVTTSQ